MEESVEILKDTTLCYNCFHKDICKYQSEKEEVLNKLIGHLDNISYDCSAFDISITCRHYSTKLFGGVR